MPWSQAKAVATLGLGLSQYFDNNSATRRHMTLKTLWDGGGRLGTSLCAFKSKKESSLGEQELIYWVTPQRTTNILATSANIDKPPLGHIAPSHTIRMNPG